MYAIPSRVTAYALEPSALHFKSATPSAGYSSNAVERLKSIRNSRPFAEFFSQELKHTHSGQVWMANAQLRAKRQRLGIHALRLEPVCLTRRAIIICSLSGVQVRSVTCPRASNSSRRDSFVTSATMIESSAPLTLDFNHAGESFFVRAEHRFSISAERTFLCEFLPACCGSIQSGVASSLEASPPGGSAAWFPNAQRSSLSSRTLPRSSCPIRTKLDWSR